LRTNLYLQLWSMGPKHIGRQGRAGVTSPVTWLFDSP